MSAMNLQSGSPGETVPGGSWRPLSGARRTRLLLALVVVLLGAVGVLARGLGGTAAAVPARVNSASLPTFKRALGARLRGRRLDYHWIVCVPSGTRFQGTRVVRCNVDFGEPHIVAYCSVFRGGRLLTSEEEAAIPCGHDNAGYSARIVEYK